MNERIRAAFLAGTEEMNALTDAELIAKWTSAGRRLLAEAPEQFDTQYITTLSAFTDAFDLEPTSYRASRLGAHLARSARYRILLARLTAITHARLASTLAS